MKQLQEEFGEASEESGSANCMPDPLVLLPGIDSKAFYEALRFSQRASFTDIGDSYNEIQNIDEAIIYEDEGPF